jgi:phosphatidylinositol glycan class H protein
MLTTTPYLRIRRPSPTAVEFTVSTLPPLTTPLRLTLYAIYLLRGILSVTILLFLYAMWASSPYGTFPGASSTSTSTPTSTPFLSTATLEQLLHAILVSPPGRLAMKLAKRTTIETPPRLQCVVVLLSLAALYALTQRLHTEESLLVLRGLGIQMCSSKSSILAGRATTRFLPTEKIQDVLVNEAFHGFGVRYYLVVVVDGEPDVVVVFPKLLPRADVVERVWKGVRECLYERRVGGSGVGLYGKS